MRKGSFLPFWSRRWFLPHALPPVAIILGMTLLLSPASAQQSNSSEEHLTIWNRLSERFGETLNQHEATLNELYTRLQTSEANGQLLTGLCAELSRQNEDLKNYNGQIAERMQDRDEDLALAYDRIDKLEKRWLKALITIVVMASLIAGFIAVKVLRILRVIPL
jgi:uncharacterized membrane protein YheB (UPF0754 family)